MHTFFTVRSHIWWTFVPIVRRRKLDLSQIDERLRLLRLRESLVKGVARRKRIALARGILRGMAASEEVHKGPKFGYRFMTVNDALERDARVIGRDVKRAKRFLAGAGSGPSQ